MVKASVLIWIGSPQLMLAAGFLFIGAVPERKAPLLNALRLGKFLELASLLLFVVLLRDATFLGSGFEAFFVTLAPFVVALIDVVVLIVLLSYRLDRGQR